MTAKVKHPFVCKHCKAPVVSKTNLRTLFGYSHGKRCPRRNKW